MVASCASAKRRTLAMANSVSARVCGASSASASSRSAAVTSNAARSALSNWIEYSRTAASPRAFTAASTSATSASTGLLSLIWLRSGAFT